MKVYGLDFTSAPTASTSQAIRQKRLKLAECEFDNGELSVKGFRLLNGKSAGDFSAFEKWLNSAGPWVAGIDFPFGQPAEFVHFCGEPADWGGYVEGFAKSVKVDNTILPSFEFKVRLHMAIREEKGGKQLLSRACDRKAGSQSPMKLEFIPVGKMFAKGAHRLLRSSCQILPMRPSQDNRLIFEAYPALVVRNYISRDSYKADDPNKQTKEHVDARKQIVNAIRSERKVKDQYGFTVQLTDEFANVCVADVTGDTLDSILCAMQGAWAWSKRESNYGIPVDASIKDEGWIVDPQMV